MRAYLVQHAKATSEEEHPDRPLTEAGRAEARRVGGYLARAGALSPGRIFHSGETRARQTAEILAASLAPPIPPEEEDGLAPLDDPASWAGRLAEATDEIMLVGHMPHMARLAGLLVSGDAGARPVFFRNGGVVCLERGDEGWGLRWAVTPEVAPDLR